MHWANAVQFWGEMVELTENLQGVTARPPVLQFLYLLIIVVVRVITTNQILHVNLPRKIELKGHAELTL